MNSDYIIRIIEQFVKALAGIIRLRKEGHHEEAYQEIQKVSQKFLDMDIANLLKKSPEQLLERFRNEYNQIDADRAILCADLLYELALLSQAQHYEDVSLKIKKMCLYLYQNAIPFDKAYQTAHYLDRITVIEKELGICLLTTPPCRVVCGKTE